MFANLILRDLNKIGEFSSTNLIRILEEAKENNIKKLVIAPVYSDEKSGTSIREVKTVVEELNSYLKSQRINLTVYAANLIRDNYENVKEYIQGNLGSINDSDYILIGVEESNNLDDLLEIIFEYRLRNLIPIIVGPEKINEIIKNHKKIEKLIAENCLFQLDVGSLKGVYGNEIKKTAKKLMKRDIYKFIGFEEEIEKNYIKDKLDDLGKKGLFVLNPEGVLAKKIIRDSKKKKKSLLSRVLEVF